LTANILKPNIFIILLSMLITMLLSSICSAAPPSCTGAIGVDWNGATLNADFPARHAQASYVFDNKMWIVSGGGNAYPHHMDSWWSTNGADWYAATLNTAFIGRSYPGYVTYNAEMWIIGGDSNGITVNDVWHSSNGADWFIATGNANFPIRDCMAALSYNNRMWVIGGNHNESTPYGMTNDVWWSTNGVAWTQATASAAFSPRSCVGAVVFNGGTGDRMWIIGGQTQNGYSNDVNDVWSSNDGVTWTMETANAGFTPRQDFACYVYNGEIYVVGGVDSSINRLNDVWASSDGVNWTQRTPAAQFDQRQTQGLVYNNMLWVLGGWGGNSFDDVWYSCGVSPMSPTFTPSETPNDTSSCTPTITVTCTIICTPTITQTTTAVPADLKIEKSATGDQPEIGADVTFKITVRNDTLQDATNLIIWDTLPVEVIYSGYSAAVAPVVTGNYVSFMLPLVTAGTVAYVYIRTKMTSYNGNYPIENRAWCDYNDNYFTMPSRHPAICSATCFYPEHMPIVYPNPFNPDTAVNGTLKFSNLIAGTLIQIYSLSGELVYNINASGINEIWHGRNVYGSKASPGIYYYVIKTPDGHRYIGKLYVVN
jgi:uncharacterized repeat protein (TIGR01451 family)